MRDRGPRRPVSVCHPSAAPLGVFNKELVSCPVKQIVRRLAEVLIGAGLWSHAKGYDPVVGVFLAFLGPLGLLMLVCLPDESRAPDESQVGE